MNSFKKKTAILLSLLILSLCLFPSVAFAAGSVSVSFNKSSVSVGDTVTATLTFSGGSVYIGGVDALVSYDSALLQYTGASGDGTANIASGKGKVLLETTSTSKTSLRIMLTFKAIAVGTAAVSITGSDVVDWDGITVCNATTSKSVTVKEKSAPTSSSTPTESDTTTPEPSGVTTAIEVLMGGVNKYLWTDLKGVTLPEGFAAAEASYGTSKLKAGKNEANGLIIYYITDSEGNNGSFYLYNKDSQLFYLYATVASSPLRYVILEPGEDVKIPEGYTETTQVVGDFQVKAWMSERDSASFFLVYAMNEDGVAGFYSYDRTEKTIQKYSEPLLASEPAEPSETSSETAPVIAPPAETGEAKSLFDRIVEDDGILALLAGLVGVVIILSVILLNALIRVSKRERLAYARAGGFREQKDEAENEGETDLEAPEEEMTEDEQADKERR